MMSGHARQLLGICDCTLVLGQPHYELSPHLTVRRLSS